MDNRKYIQTEALSAREKLIQSNCDASNVHQLYKQNDEVLNVDSRVYTEKTNEINKKIAELTKSIDDSFLTWSEDYHDRGRLYLREAKVFLNKNDEISYELFKQAIIDANIAYDAALINLNKFRALLLRGEIYYWMKNPDVAIKDCIEAIDFLGSDMKYHQKEVVRAYYILGNAYNDTGNIAEAICWLLKASRGHAFSEYRVNDLLNDVLLNIVPETNLSQISKNKLFKAIKMLAPEKQISLLRDCLNPETGLGKRMWEPENNLVGILGVFNHKANDFVALQCNYGKGMLREIEDHLMSIDPTHEKHQPLNKKATQKKVSDLNNDCNKRYDALYSL